MTLRDDLNAASPRLRRFARALVAGHPAGLDLADDLVHATLMRALGARTVGSESDLIIRLYATVTQLHRDLAVTGHAALVAGGGRLALVSGTAHPGNPQLASTARQTRLSAALMSLPIEEREALLLVALEGFDHGAAARILRISRPILLARLTQARTALDLHLRARPVAKTRTAPNLRVVGGRDS